MQLTKFLFPLLACSSLAAAGVLKPRALTAAQVVNNINIITNQSMALQAVARSLPGGTTSHEKRQINPFQALINGFTGLITIAQADITQMSGTQPFGTDDAEAVCAAFTGFVVVHQQLLGIVIGKAGVLNALFLSPVAAVLRVLEGVVDTIAFGVIGLVPACADKATADKNALDATLATTICAYTPSIFGLKPGCS